MRKLVFLLLAAALMLPAAARAGDDDHDLARRAVEEGRALPLADILEKIKPAFPGKVIEVELDTEDNILVYELKVLSPQGQLQELDVDAKTGKVLKIEDEDDD
jgi:uncharacterized membrane protein YkoI